MDPFMELQEANMNSNENIKRLREKRRTLENEYNSGSPVTTRKSADETSTEDSVGRVSSVPDLPSNNGGQKPARPSMSWAPIRMSSVNWGNTVLEEEPTLQNQLKRLESKIKAIEIKEMRKSMAVEKIAVEEEEKKDEEPKFPRDAYSFLALNGPKATLLWYELWPERKPCLCFLFGMTAYIFQAAFHAMMIVGDFGGTSVGDFKSGGLAEFFPPKTSPTILIAQFLSLLAYIAFPDSALKDLVIACRIFPGRSQNPDDPVGGLRLACILKATQGILGIANLLLLVMTSSAVYEIVLSFIIINFISSIDDHAFTLAENGMLGPSFKKEADMIAEEKLPGRCNDRCKSATHRVVMLGSALALFVSMFVIIAFQNDSSTSKAFGRGNGVLGMGTRRLGDRDNMELLAIQLDDVQSSRQNVDTSDWDFVRLTESQWRSAVPLATNFALDCDGKSVLTVDVDQSMVNKMQSVWVKEGSSCRLAVKNSTGSIDAAKTDVAAPEPIWHVNYTLSQGQVEILNQQSSQEGIVDFTLLPNCYFEEFENKADIANNKAIGWLVEDDPQVSRCGEEDFIERYALATMNFAMNDEEKFITREEHCGWNAISCSEGQVNAIVLEEQGLKGRIPSEIGLLTNLKKLQLSSNDISSIPANIGLLTNLQDLLLSNNDISSLPIEMESLTSLEALVLSGNQLKSLNSTEIGSLQSLQLLWLDGNQLSSFPDDLSLLKELKSLDLGGNALISLPTEIGRMTSLTSLKLYDNQIKSLPSEIGLLTNLKSLYLHNNKLEKLPSEIEELIKLSKITLYGNHNITLSR